ncbi:hypothetical protein HBB16_18820, partial [Pseudonocardia sp. MCCB 268]|nr:hypothetical protein [Pseudonocardia cytotoxica]
MVEAGLLVVTAGDGYALRWHGLMTEVVAGDLLPAERIGAARPVRPCARGPPALVPRPAHHRQKVGHPEQALEATVSAAEEAERLAWLRRGALALAAGRDPAGPRRGNSTRRLPEKAVAAAELAGDHDSAVALAVRAARRAGRAHRARRGRPAARLGRYLDVGGQAGRRRRPSSARRGRPARGPVPGRGRPVRRAARAEVLAGYAAALLSGPTSAGPAFVAQQALAPARRVGEPRAVASVLGARFRCRSHPRQVLSRFRFVVVCLTLAIRVTERSNT